MATEDVEATISRISNYKGIIGCIVVSPEGQILKSTCDAAVTEMHTQLIPPLATLARSMIRDIRPQNDLEFLRVRSMKHEIMVSPNAEFTLIAIQSTSPEKGT